MNDPAKVKALVRIGSLMGRPELEKLFKASYESSKGGKTLTGWGVNGRTGTLSVLDGMSPADVFTLVDEALSTFDALTSLGRLDIYLGPVRSTGATVALPANPWPIQPGCAV